MSTKAPRKSARPKPAAGPPGPKSKSKSKAKPKPEPRPKSKPKRKPEPRSPAREAAPQQAAPAPPPFELDPGRLEEGLRTITSELKHWANKGRYTRVRFRFRGKQLLPDLPLAAVVAAEGLSFYWAGILRALVVNVAGGALLTMELVNDADKRVGEGREALLGGDLDRALELFGQALQMDRDNAGAHLNIGVALKLRGDVGGARTALEQAARLDPDGPAGAEAARILETLARAQGTVALPGPDR
jgi:tetratricopeptide (TPR) repeat protein